MHGEHAQPHGAHPQRHGQHGTDAVRGLRRQGRPPGVPNVGEVRRAGRLTAAVGIEDGSDAELELALGQRSGTVTGVGEHLGVPTVPDEQDGRPVGADDPRRGEGQPGQQRQVDRLGGDGGEDP